VACSARASRRSQLSAAFAAGSLPERAVQSNTVHSDEGCGLLQGKNENEKKKFAEFFSEVQRAVDSKQLRPMIRTQYMRTAFQVTFTAASSPAAVGTCTQVPRK
jgi:VTC domain